MKPLYKILHLIERVISMQNLLSIKVFKTFVEKSENAEK